MNWRKEIPHWVVLALVVLLTVVGLVKAPDRIPIHWNAKGEVDGWGSKWVGLLIVPAITIAFYGLLLWIPRWDPARKNYERFAGAYYVLRLAILLMMAGMHVVLVAAAVGIDVDVGMWVMLGVGLLLAVIGWVMGDIEPNWFVGVRTPWTLTSQLSWRKTHQQARWVFLLAGIAFVVAGVLPGVWPFFTAIGLMLAGVLWLLIYSYLVWKRDPDRSGVPKTG